MIRLGILASHRGTNFQAIIDACQAKKINAQPVVAISNNSDAEALTRATAAGITAVHLSSKTHPDPQSLDEAIASTLQAHGVDLVVTAGYMKKLGPVTLRTFKNKIVNVHPSLLPQFGGKGMYGLNVHTAVIASGARKTGITIHWVDENYDTGAIIAQKTIPVLPDDVPESLAKRVLGFEHQLLIETLSLLTEQQDEN